MLKQQVNTLLIKKNSIFKPLINILIFLSDLNGTQILIPNNAKSSYKDQLSNSNSPNSSSLCISSPNSSSLYSGNDKPHKVGIHCEHDGDKNKYFESYDDCDIDEDIDLSDIESNESDYGNGNDGYHVLNETKSDNEEDENAKQF